MTLTRRFAALVATCLLVVAPLVGVGSPAVADEPVEPINLVGNPGFWGEPEAAPSAWSCDEGVTTQIFSPGAEFVQVLPLTAEGVPDVPAQGPVSAAAPAAAGTDARSSLGRWLVGTPTASSRAGCSQIVPVRPGASYTFSASVSGGPVFLGTDAGVVSAVPGDSWTSLATTFTVAPTVDTVRIQLFGRYAGDPYQVDGVSLVGPESTTRVPGPPTDLEVDRQTSHSLRLTWSGAAGASRYEVRRDGIAVRTVTATSALVVGLDRNRGHEFSVVALNSAGASTPSAPVVVPPVLIDIEPPAAPGWDSVEPWADNTVLLNFWQSDRATDGYFVYVDGIRTGWLLEAPGILSDLAPGPHTLAVTAINSAGDSPASEPFDIIITPPDTPLDVSGS